MDTELDTQPETLPVTLCVPPRNGELCAPIRIRLPGPHSTQQLTARHRVTGVSAGEDGSVLIAVEITDPATARPVDVRFDVVPETTAMPPRSRRLGVVDTAGDPRTVYATYLGPIADEN